MAGDELHPKLITRQDARRLNLVRYFTGRACPRGHVVQRYTSTGGCVDCGKERFDEWYRDNPDLVLRKNRRYRKDNPKKVRAAYRKRDKRRRAKDPEKMRAAGRRRNRRYYQNHPEFHRERHQRVYWADPIAARARASKWAKNNPDKVNARAGRRRAAKAGAEGVYTTDDVLRLLREQRHRCAAPWCGRDISTSYTADHKVPITRGGSNWPRNIQLLCRPCNSEKGTKTMDEWVARRMLDGKEIFHS